MAYSLPEDVDQRPVTVVGAGTLGRKIATVFAAGGDDVRVLDASAEQLEAGRDYDLVNTEHDHRYRSYWQTYHQLTARKGVTAQLAKIEMRRRPSWWARSVSAASDTPPCASSSRS